MSTLNQPDAHHQEREAGPEVPPPVPDTRPETATTAVPAPSLGSLKRTLVLMCLVYALGMLCFQAFNYVYQAIGTAIDAGPVASMITALPGSLLGIFCFIYGGLGDFVSLRKMFVAGMVLLLVGSLGGFFLHFDNVWMVVVMRAIQTAGGQMAGSIYLILCARYLEGRDRVKYFGIFNAVYAAAAIVGLVCGGVLVTVGWAWLFMIPVLSVFCVPSILRGLPDGASGPSQHVDVPGFVIFGIGISLLTFFFGAYQWWVLAAAAVAFVVFAVYIHKAEQPFITPAFFKNSRWLMAVCLLVIFYFYNHVIAPTYRSLGAGLYGMDSAQVSLLLIPAYVVWIIVATNSGAIYTKLGRKPTALLSAGLLLAGFWVTAFVVDKGQLAIALASCVIFGGTGLVYSPYFDTVVGTVSPEESGRAVGMNDLAINVSASIGVAVFTPMMSVTAATPANNFLGVAGAAVASSNLFLIYGLVALVGMVFYLFAYKHITTSTEPVPGERPLE